MKPSNTLSKIDYDKIIKEGIKEDDYNPREFSSEECYKFIKIAYEKGKAEARKEFLGLIDKYDYYDIPIKDKLKQELGDD